MTGSQLCDLGGVLVAVKGWGYENGAWLARAPQGFRFTDGRHEVRREMDQTWEAVMGHLGLERCGPGCACFAAFDDGHHCTNPNCCPPDYVR